MTFVAPYGSGADANIDVIIEAGDTQYDDSAFATLGPGFEVPDVVETGKSLVGNPAMLLGAGALAVGLFGLLFIALIGAGDNRPQSVRQLEAYFNGTGGEQAGEEAAQGDQLGGPQGLGRLGDRASS